MGLGQCFAQQGLLQQGDVGRFVGLPAAGACRIAALASLAASA